MTSEKKKFGELTKAEMPLFIDLYELTMAQGHLERGHNISSSFDLSFREMPEDRGYIIVAGLEDVVEYVESISFEEEALTHISLSTRKSTPTSPKKCAADSEKRAALFLTRSLGTRSITGKLVSHPVSVSPS